MLFFPVTGFTRFTEENLCTDSANKLFPLVDHLATLHCCVDVKTEDVLELFATSIAGP